MPQEPWHPASGGLAAPNSSPGPLELSGQHSRGQQRAAPTLHMPWALTISPQEAEFFQGLGGGGVGGNPWAEYSSLAPLLRLPRTSAAGRVPGLASSAQHRVFIEGRLNSLGNGATSKEREGLLSPPAELYVELYGEKRDGIRKQPGCGGCCHCFQQWDFAPSSTSWCPETSMIFSSLSAAGWEQHV